MNNEGMKKHVMKAAACFLAGTMTIAGTGISAMAAGESLVGIGASKEEVKVETEAVQEEAAENEEAVEDTENTAAPAQESMINTVAVAQVDSYINIRTSPDENADLVGKLYNNNVATIIGEEGDWYLVQSGNCQGYVAKYLLTTGSAAQEVVASVGTPVAQVNAEALMVRSDASEEAEVVDMVTENQIVYLEEDLGGWAKVSTDNGTGYVSADYVSYATYLPQAESVEEEAARIEAEEAAYAAYVAQQEAEYEAYLAQQQAEWEAQNQAWIEYLQSQGAYADEAQAAADQAAADQAYLEQVAADAQAAVDEAYNSGDEQAAIDAQAAADQAAADAAAAAEATAQAQAEAAAADQAVIDTAEQNGIDTSSITSDGTSSLRQQVVDYALQFVGNPYVWGGTSLTNGADCSGFTQSVMADNGISINRTAGAQSQGGTSVDLSNIQPGDLLFYEGSGDYGIGHVSMYIGNGQVVHASNSTDGIIVSDVNYRTPVSAKSYLD
ncbi:MAG: C40 family peptidase [Eubacteriales bacterium]|nr:C40 family peptidase [Eubacteriales bacterium]